MTVSSIAVLIRRALTLVRRHLLVFTVVALVAIGAQWLAYTRLSSPAIPPACAIIVGAIVDAIVLGIVKGDVDRWTPAHTWERILERLWAVVIVNFIATYVTTYGLVSIAAGDMTDRIVAIPILLIAASIVFAETIAVVADEEAWWFIVIRAIGGSMRVSWSPGVLSRAISLFVLQLVPGAIASALLAAMTHGHPPATSFWSDVPLGILCSIPLDVLIVLAYFDASGYEPDRTCGE